MKPNNNPRYIYTNVNKENKIYRPYTSQSLKKTNPQLIDSKEKFPSINKKKDGNQLEKSYKYSKKFSIKHPYWEREQLFDRCIKLQNELNNLNAQYRMTIIENHHQKETINKQNKLLNEYNNKQFENQNYQTFKSKTQENEFNDEINFDSDYENQTQNEKRLTRKKFIKTLTDDERKQITKEENEKEQFEKDEKMKLLSEALISNLKMRCKELVKENQEKDEEIKKLKRDMKSSKVSELERERDIYAEEMNIIKQKLEDALDKVNFYEKRDTDIKKLITLKNKQTQKINVLNKKNDRNVQQSEKRIMELEKELEAKNKRIMILERDLKKKNLNEQIERQKKERYILIDENEKKFEKYNLKNEEEGE